jgi:hypothetical protein
MMTPQNADLEALLARAGQADTRHLRALDRLRSLLGDDLLEQEP